MGKQVFFLFTSNETEKYDYSGQETNKQTKANIIRVKSHRITSHQLHTIQWKRLQIGIVL